MTGWSGERGELDAVKWAQAAYKLLDPVREVAQGRVYTGNQGIEAGIVDELGGMFLFFVESFVLMFAGWGQLAKTVRQVYFIGARSLIVILVTGLFTGMVLGLQGYHNLKKFGSEGKKTAVVSTINGDANVPFYKELGNQGISAEDIPVVAFSVGEEELSGIDTKPLVGHLVATVETVLEARVGVLHVDGGAAGRTGHHGAVKMPGVPKK